MESTPSHPRFTDKEIEALEEPSVQAEVIFCGGGVLTFMQIFHLIACYTQVYFLCKNNFLGLLW